MQHLLTTTLALAGLAACGSSSGSTPDTQDAPPAGTPTALSGTLGSLGATQATMSSLMIVNSGETLVYFSSSPLTCDQLTVSRWLGGTAAGSQVVELVLASPPKVGAFPVPPNEVNYAPGGMSSSYEVSADSGTITFSSATPMVAVAGTLTAKFPSGSITGHFEATYCANGQGY